jgi:hypothetical protein
LVRKNGQRAGWRPHGLHLGAACYRRDISHGPLGWFPAERGGETVDECIQIPVSNVNMGCIVLRSDGNTNAAGSGWGEYEY